jgi:hypothetical protein
MPIDSTQEGRGLVGSRGAVPHGFVARALDANTLLRLQSRAGIETLEARATLTRCCVCSAAADIEAPEAPATLTRCCVCTAAADIDTSEAPASATTPALLPRRRGHGNAGLQQFCRRLQECRIDRGAPGGCFRAVEARLTGVGPRWLGPRWLGPRWLGWRWLGWRWLGWRWLGWRSFLALVWLALV